MSDIVKELLSRASDQDGIGWTPTTVIPVPARLLHHAADRIEQLEAALKPLCCTCDRAASDECSRSEVNCPFWNARTALGEERT